MKITRPEYCSSLKITLIQLVQINWEEVIMASLLFGFVGMVLFPALILSLILGKFINAKSEYEFREDNMRFTISSDSK